MATMKPFNPMLVDWEKLFETQYGGRYVGFPHQRGGSFGSMFRFLIPALPDLMRAPVTREAIDATADIMKEISEGANPLETIKRRGRQAVKKLIGVGKKKRVIRKKKASRARSVFLPAV